MLFFVALIVLSQSRVWVGLSAYLFFNALLAPPLLQEGQPGLPHSSTLLTPCWEALHVDTT